MSKGKRGRPTNHRRIEIARRRNTIADLYGKGFKQTEIARKLGVEQQLVSSDLKVIHEIWKKEQAFNLDERRWVELAKIDKVEREAWEAWERSQKFEETFEHEGQTLTKHVKRTSSGNPKFLDTCLKCVERRCKLLGLDAPEKHKIEAPLPTAIPALAELLRQRLMGAQPGPGEPTLRKTVEVEIVDESAGDDGSELD